MKPLLIAECCQNHNGRRDVLREMIHRAAEAGADYVKIQAIRSHELTHRERFDDGREGTPDGTVKTIHRPYAAELERLAKLDLTLEEEAWFAEECRRAGYLFDDHSVHPFVGARGRGVSAMTPPRSRATIAVRSLFCATSPSTGRRSSCRREPPTTMRFAPR